MKFRSWQIILLGILFQFGIWVRLFFLAKGSADFAGVILLPIIGIVVVFSSVASLLPLVLLIFKKTRKFGAILGIILGIVAIAVRWGIIIGPFLIMAGIVSLWKKV